MNSQDQTKTTDDLPRNSEQPLAGRPYYAPAAPDGTPVGEMHGDSHVDTYRAWFWRQNKAQIIRGLTTERLVALLRDWNLGYIKYTALLFEEILERDSTIKSVSAKRTAAVGRKKWSINIVEGKQDDPEAQKQKATLQFFYDNLRVSDVVDQNKVGGVRMLAKQIVLGMVGLKWSVHEILWRQFSDDIELDGENGARKVTAQLNRVPLWFFENRTGRLRFLAQDIDWDGADLADNSWLVASGDGVMVACSICHLFKMMSLKDWVRYNENHGIPGVIGMTKAPVNSPIWRSFEQAVESITNEYRGVINAESGSIEKLDMSSNGEIPFPGLYEEMNRANSTLWRGGDLSTMSATANAAGQGASVQGEESDSLDEDDCMAVSEVCQLQLDRMVLKIAYGENVVPMAYFEYGGAGRINTDQELKVDTGLYAMGVPLDGDELREKYQRSKPKPGSEVIQKPAGPAGGEMGGFDAGANGSGIG